MSQGAHDLDLGSDHWLDWVRWVPDDLPGNRQQYGFPLPVIERAGAMIGHKKPDDSECWGHVHFDIPAVRQAFPNAAVWQVASWEPLTISPSVLCTICGDHGFIRNGRWEK